MTYPALDGSDAAHAFTDMLLDPMIGAAGPNTDAILLSNAGILLAAGPGFAADSIVHGASAMDVAATILGRFGLAAPGARARPLHGAVIAMPLCPIDVPVPPRPKRTTTPSPPEPAIALIEELDRKNRRHAAIEAVLMNDHAAALPLLRAALADQPGNVGLQLLLGQSAFATGDATTYAAQGQALGLQFQAPAAHQHPGLLYARHRRWAEADRALRTALAQQPGLPGAADALCTLENAAAPQASNPR